MRLNDVDHNPFAGEHSQADIGFVAKPLHVPSGVVVAHPAFEAHACTCCGALFKRTSLARWIDAAITETKQLHVVHVLNLLRMAA